MKKLLLIVGLCVFGISGMLMAQNTPGSLVPDNEFPEVYVKEHVRNKEPVPYKYTREGDVMWSKVIYRLVDLRERMNFPYYYPIDPIGDRMSLIDVMLTGIKEHNKRAFAANSATEEFVDKLEINDIDKAMGADTIKVPVVMPNGTTQYQTTVTEPKKDEVKQLMIKEMWFFDRNYSKMDVRIIGICPIRVYYKLLNGQPTDQLVRKKTFWIYYPEYRDIFSQYEAYNLNNDAQRISYDDMLWQRRFSSIIVQTSNVYENRRIAEYTAGLETLYESEKIKDWLFKMEHDLWEF